MKAFRTIILSLALSLMGAAMPLQAQSYEESFKALLSTHSVILVGDSADIYQQVMDMMKAQGASKGIENDAKATKLVCDYFATQWESDCDELFLPYFKRNMSAQELAEHVARLRQPNVLAALKRISVIDLGDKVEQFDEEALASPDFKPTPLLCDAAYQSSCSRYMEISGTNNGYSGLFTMLESVMAELKGEEKAAYERILNNMKAELPAVLCNAYYSGGITKADFDCVSEAMDTPEGIKVRAANKSISDDMLSVSTSLVMKILAWMMERM